jgi:hypothetical protein
MGDQARYVTQSNELNMAALNKYNFPNLKQIRALDKSMLEDLNKRNGPSRDDDDDGGYDRWLKWWTMCANAGIRLEDCTGAPLGTLPGTDGEGDDGSSGESSEGDGGSSGESSDKEVEDTEEQDFHAGHNTVFFLLTLSSRISANLYFF